MGNVAPRLAAEGEPEELVPFYFVELSFLIPVEDLPRVRVNVASSVRRFALTLVFCIAWCCTESYGNMQMTGNGNAYLKTLEQYHKVKIIVPVRRTRLVCIPCSRTAQSRAFHLSSTHPGFQSL